MRAAVLAYGIFCYAAFLATFLYAAGFVSNFLVPKTIDSPRTGSVAAAVAINLLLLGVFVVQHSGMARPAFKRRWTRHVPEPIERSTYVLASSLALFLVFWQWRPIGGTVWNVTDPLGRALLWLVCANGWLLVLYATCLINHCDLFGLRQTWLYFRGRKYTPLKFDTPGPYRMVRHPLYIGWLLAVWATPKMSATHLLFAAGLTVYILTAIRWEEKDLASHFGPQYTEYQASVPMLIPRLSWLPTGRVPKV
jgi:protein-S-isoprenylcysteine O-methyltransferase Ste14